MIRVRRAASLVAAAALCASLAACSVVRAATTDPGADVSVLAVGAPRARVEAVLGPSVRVWMNDSGTAFRTYQYDAGREASADDAFGFAVLDVISVFMWELGPLLNPKDESFNRHRIDRRVVVSYGVDDTVLGTFEEFAVLPADGRVPPDGKPWTPVPAPAR